MDKGQGALEYLLLVGGAILLAVIVISILFGVFNGQSNVLLTVSEGDCLSFYLDNGQIIKIKADSEKGLSFSKPFILGTLENRSFVNPEKINYIEITKEENCLQGNTKREGKQ